MGRYVNQGVGVAFMVVFLLVPPTLARSTNARYPRNRGLLRASRAHRIRHARTQFSRSIHRELLP